MRDTTMLRYDRVVLMRSFHAAFSGWRDWTTLAILLGFGAVMLRSWYGGASPLAAQIGAVAAGVLAGVAAARGIEARLAHHIADSPFAPEALTPASARRYALAWHGVALAALLIVAAIAGFAAIPMVLAGFVAGAVAGHAALRLPPLPRMPGSLGAGLRRSSIVSVVAALVHAAGVAALRGTLSGEAAPIAAAAAAGLLLLVLSPVDDKVVRFMARSGRGPFAAIARHIRAPLIFAGVDAALMLLLLSPMAAGLVVTVAVAVLLFVSARVLVYSVHSRRAADLVLTLCGAAGALLFTAMPVLLPVLLLFALVHFYRRARAVTWLYA